MVTRDLSGRAVGAELISVSQSASEGKLTYLIQRCTSPRGRSCATAHTTAKSLWVDQKMSRKKKNVRDLIPRTCSCAVHPTKGDVPKLRWVPATHEATHTEHSAQKTKASNHTVAHAHITRQRAPQAVRTGCDPRRSNAPSSPKSPTRNHSCLVASLLQPLQFLVVHLQFLSS